MALFGGTFDPPHCGHLGAARAAADAFELDRVLFAPVGRQPLKLAENPASYHDRLAMVRLACEADPRFEASEIDAPHTDGSPNFTSEALRALREQNPETQLFAIAGADSFLTLRHWHQSDRLLELAQWIVVSRPGFHLNNLATLQISPRQRSRVHLVETMHEEVSATELRRRLAAGESCTDWLPKAVATYIAKHDLYTSDRS